MKGYIYQLVDPKTKKPIYVGSTKRLLLSRLQSHLSSAKSGVNSPIYKYIRDNSFTPEIELLEEVDLHQLSVREEKWIQKLITEGVKLLNKNGRRDKATKSVLIHGMDEKLYKAVVKLATDEKRSVGKQAEYMLAKYLECEGHKWETRPMPSEEMICPPQTIVKK